MVHGDASRDELAINALGGNDRVDATALAADALKLGVDGGTGDDTILGGAGADVLRGGAGNDLVDGNQGADIALLGAGDDRFVWDPGDGSDVIEGQAGHDAMTFNGSNAGEQFDVSANGARVRFTRDVGNITMDLAGVEEIDLAALGGADRLTVNDLAGTDLTEIQTDLAGSREADDGAQDQVIVNGTARNDVITASGAGSKVNGSGLVADAIQFHADGGDGNDVLTGGAGDDTLLGGPGDDVLNGGPGQDVLDGGTGNNVLNQ